MNKLMLFTLFLFLIRDNYAFTGESANYIMTHSNLNYGTGYSDGCSEAEIVAGDGICHEGERCNQGDTANSTNQDCSGYFTVDAGGDCPNGQLCQNFFGTMTCIAGSGSGLTPTPTYSCASYSIDYSLVPQPVGLESNGGYTLQRGFYFGNANDGRLSGLLRKGGYPFLMLAMMIFIATDQQRKKEDEKEE